MAIFKSTKVPRCQNFWKNRFYGKLEQMVTRRPANPTPVANKLILLVDDHATINLTEKPIQSAWLVDYRVL